MFKKGAHPNIMGHLSFTALEAAKYNSDKSVIDLLKHYGVNWCVRGVCSKMHFAATIRKNKLLINLFRFVFLMPPL